MDDQIENLLEAVDDTINGIWDKHDSDKSGFLEKTEFKKFLGEMYDSQQIKNLTEEAVDQIIVKYEGEHGDKKISKDEMRKYILALYGITEEVSEANVEEQI